MFKLLRFYALASFLAVAVTAIVLTWHYRKVSIQGIVDLAEHSNTTLVRAVISPMLPALVEFVSAAATIEPNGAPPPPLPPELSRAIMELMRDRQVTRIKIYNRNGVVVFSTWPSQIGTDMRHNGGFLSAIKGRVESTLVYRDTFNRFDAETEEDNLAQTYLPIRAGPTEPILGVFEIYSDVSRLVLMTERTDAIIMVGSTLILAALYAALLLIVHRTSKAIETQHRAIRERTETLEMLSSQLLKSEESHKQKIAFDLHEGLAQTLAALKLRAENGQSAGDGTSENDMLGSIIPALQGAIQEVRTIATEIRPPSLDDLGLLPTINWLCRKVEQQYPTIRVIRTIRLLEDDIPQRLKIIVYRIIASMLDDMAQHAHSGHIHLELKRDKGVVTLSIGDAAADELDRTAIPLARIDPGWRAGLARMEELTTLSGGEFHALDHSSGGATLSATWSV